MKRTSNNQRFMREVKRGDIFMAKLGNDNIIGSEQKGTRPVIVLSNNVGNKHSPTIIVACITTQSKTTIPTHMQIQAYEPSTIMLEQIKTICKSRLSEYVCTISDAKVRELNEKLKISLGIEI